MKRYLPLLFAFLFLGISLVGQPFNRNKLDSFFNMLSDKNMAMASIAISKDGKVIYQRAIGAARLTSGDTIRADENTEYNLGSISKMFTATMVFQLLEEKKLSLDEKLSDYFPQLPNAGSITIGNLLYHRSGLPDFTNNTNFDDWKVRLQTEDQLLGLIAGRKPDFEPNAKAAYNNSNYLLLGFIVEKICKKPYSVVVNERVISRIGLKRTYYAHNTELSRYESASYKYFDNKWGADKVVVLANFGGAGAIVSTPTDLLKFISALFSGRLISPASLHKMQTMVDGYGMGMFPFDFDTHHGFGHNGKTEGFASSLTYYPEDKLAIAYCTNGEVYSKDDILDGVRAIYFNKPFVIPDFSPVKISDQLLDQYTGNYGSASSGITAVVTRDGSNLVLESRGQKFKLIAMDKHRFLNEQFGFFFEFNKEGKQLLIIDVESVYELGRQ
jgi:D-alanyl-D-alanine carboxypeptidase